MTRLASWQDFGTHDESAYPDLWRGCVGAWAPCLGPTGTRLHDLSRFRNWGTLTNMVPADDWVVSDGRYALDFDGSNDGVDFGSSSILNCVIGLTISLWAKRNGAGGGGGSYHAWLQRLGASTTGYQIYSPNSDNILRFYTNTIVASSYTMSDTNWHHLLVTNNGTTTRFFVDGIARGSSPQSLVDVQASTVNSFGSAGIFGSANGQMDDMRIYNRALSEFEGRLLSLRRGIAYERRKRRSVYIPQTSSLRRKILTGQV